MYASWIAIGYKTGGMDEVMHRICTAYEEKTQDKLAGLISVLEPTLVIILCVFIGMILISFLLPLLGIMSSIG
jgi:type IV pilus assembly protein PilC